MWLSYLPVPASNRFSVPTCPAVKAGFVDRVSLNCSYGFKFKALSLSFILYLSVTSVSHDSLQPVAPLLDFGHERQLTYQLCPHWNWKPEKAPFPGKFKLSFCRWWRRRILRPSHFNDLYRTIAAHNSNRSWLEYSKSAAVNPIFVTINSWETGTIKLEVGKKLVIQINLPTPNRDCGCRGCGSTRTDDACFWIVITLRSCVPPFVKCFSRYALDYCEQFMLVMNSK